ncbi:hypothetical protein Pcinc_004240 [Petrolisthes cinctipes]|nr:hypothetical protein Pcinc_004240 [Petrolisthes cinctipes]
MASVATNSVILFTILCRNYLRRTSFILYLSLAASDLLASLFSLPVVMLVVLDMEAVRPSVGTCTLNTASVVLTSYVSVGSIVSISAVRGWQFHNFSETRDQEKYTVRFIIFLLWTSGLGITIAFIFREMVDGNEMCSPQHLTKSYRSTLPLTCASITSGLLTVTLVNQLTIRKIQNSSMYPLQDRKRSSSSQIQKLARRIRKSSDPPDYINSDVTTLGGYSLFPARDSLSSRGRGEAKSHWLKTRRFSLSTVDTVDEFIEQGSRWTERSGNFLYNRKMDAPTGLLYHKTDDRSIENDEPGHSTIVPRRRRYTESAPARLKRSSNSFILSRNTEVDSTVYPSKQTHNSKMQSPTKPLNYLLNKEHLTISQSTTVSTTSSPPTSLSLPLSSQSPQSSLPSQLPNLQPATLPPLTKMSRQTSPQPKLPTRQPPSTPQSNHPPPPPPPPPSVKPKLQLSQPPPTQISQPTTTAQPKLHPSPPSPPQQQPKSTPQPQQTPQPQKTPQPQQPSQPRIQPNPSPPLLQPPVLISSNGEDDDASFHGPPIFKMDDHSGSEVEMDHHLGDVFEPLDIQESVPATQKNRSGQDIEGPPSVRTQLPNVIESFRRGDQGPLLHNTTLIDIAVAPPDDHEVNTAAWRSDILDNIPASTGITNPVDVWEKRQQQGVRRGSLKKLRKIDGAITTERDPWPLLTVLPKVDPQMPGTAEDLSQSFKQSDSEDNPRNQSDSHTQASKESDSQEGSQNQSNGHTQTPKHSDSKVSSQKLSRDHKYTQKRSQTQGRNSKQTESHDNTLQQLGNTEKRYKNQDSRGEELRQANINNRKMEDSYNSNQNRTNKQSDTQTRTPNESSDKKETPKQPDSIEETYEQFDTLREKSRQPDARKEKPKPTYDPQTSSQSETHQEPPKQSDTQKVPSSPVSMTSTITCFSLKTLDDDSSIGYLGDLSDHPESPTTTPHQKLSREQRTERIKVLNSLSRTASRMEAIVDSDDSDDEDDVRSRIRPSTTLQAEKVNISQLDGQQTEALCTNQVMENAAHSVTRECVKTSRCLVAIFSLAYLPLLLMQLLVTLAPNSITLSLTVSYQAFLNAIHPAVLVYNNQLLRNAILKWCRCLAPFNKFARKVQPLENLIPKTVPLEDLTSGTLPLDKLVPSTRNIGNLLSKTIPVDNLLPKSIPVDKLLPKTISVDKLLPKSIPVDKFLPKTISVDKLLPKKIPVGKLIPKTISLDKLVPRRVPLGELVSNTIPL